MATQTNSRNLLLSTATARTVTNQKSVVVSAPVTIFLYTSAGVLSDSTATIAITATKQNTTAPVTWTNNSGLTLYSTASGGVAVITDTGTANTSTVYARASDFNALNLNSLRIIATITDVDVFSDSLTITKLQPGASGAPGTSAPKYISVIAWRWANTAPTLPITSTAAVYNWSAATVNMYPTGWAPSAAASPGGGYTLYQISVAISAAAADATTAFNWNTATLNQLGFTPEGVIGLTGDSARVAYLVTTSDTVPGAVTAGTGDVVPTSAAGTWSFSATSTLTARQYMYQVDGRYSWVNNVTTWGNPYLSNLKVGSLSALAVDTGNLTVSAIGSIKTVNKTYGEAGGFFMGNDGGTTKFSIGDKLLYTGSVLTVPAITIGSTGQISGIGTGNGTTISNDLVRPGGVNLVGNSGFLRNNEAVPTNWDIYNNSGIPTTRSVQPGGMFGQNYVRVTAGASTPTTLGIYVAQSTSDSVKSWEPGQTYCISFWARASAGGLGRKMQGLYSSMGFTSNVDLENLVLTSSWQRYVFRGVPLSNAYTASGELYISVEQLGITNPLPSGSVIDICCPKVELGTQPSSWTPSPQDTMNINLESSITAAQTNAVAAASLDATAKAATKLNKAAADTLTGPITLSTSGGIVAGNLTWDNTGTRTGGQGVAITPKGIVGHNGTKTTFVVDATSGDATFAGTLSGASGDFSGSVSTGGASYTNTASGFWTGFDNSIAKLRVGNADNYLQWTGDRLQLVGAVFGYLVLTSTVNGIASTNISGSSSGNSSWTMLPSGVISVGVNATDSLGESGLYTYSWVFVSVNGDLRISSATGSNVVLEAQGTGVNVSGILRATVRDTGSNLVAFRDFSVNWSLGAAGGVYAAYNNTSISAARYTTTSGTITANINFLRDGTCTASASPSTGQNTVTGTYWYLGGTATIGDNYWIRASIVSGTLSSGTTSTWLQLNTARTWSISTSSYKATTLKFEIAASSGGAVLVSGNVYLETIWEGDLR